MATTTKRKNLLERSLERIVAVLIKEYKPERIILFGSLAYGDVHEWSDLDLVIIKETSMRPIDRQVEVYSLVKPEVGMDLFIYTPKEFEYLRSVGFSLVKEITEKGKIIYEAGNKRMGKDS
jgi:predicted nucleotidyltransferase